MKNSKLQFKIQNWKTAFKFTLLFLIFNFALLTINLSEANAQLTPSSWQSGATGLRTSHPGAGGKTAGLTTTINTTGTAPAVSMVGGLRQGWGKLWGPSGIDLGQIKIPGIDTYSLQSETADWAHNELSFSSSLKLWVSRLTPAVLVQNTNSGNALRLFSGNLSGVSITTNAQGVITAVTDRTPAPVYPKYVAYHTANGYQVRSLSSSDLSFTGDNLPDQNWLLLWYGANSHFLGTKTPLSYSNDNGSGVTPSLPFADAYQSDVPVLLKFEKPPTVIKHSSEGGIDLAFSGNSGYTSLMPLLGRDHPKASDTESWYDTSKPNNNNLPQNITDKISFWATGNKLCSYPTTVAESYAYDNSTDTSTITENITYLNVCNGGSTTSGFAILPPILSLSMFTPDQGGQTNPLNVSVSGTLVAPAGGYSTDFGPIYGIDNANSYSWSVSNLNKYTDSKRVLTNTGSAPGTLTDELNSEIQKIISTGHYQPWIMTDTLVFDIRGAMYFLNPADVVFQLAEIAESLPVSNEKTDLINYLKTERSNYPPETIFNMSSDGAVRGPFGLNGASTYGVPSSCGGSRTMYQGWQAGCTNGPRDAFLSRLPLYNFYALGRYYELTGDPVPTTTFNQAKTILDQDMKEQDWANFSWFRESATTRPTVAVTSSNRHLAGLIGFNKLAKLSGDTEAENLGRTLLAKAAVQRLAYAKYSRYLYSSSLNVLPSNPNWMVLNLTSGNFWRAYLFNYNWTNPYDDPLHVVMMNQFMAFTHDQAGYTEPASLGRDWNYVFNGYIGAYKDTVPEVFRFLTDNVPTDSKIYLDKYTNYSPNWYGAFQEAAIGQEHNMSHPIDSYQLFMAKAMLTKDTPQNLEKYLDISWLDSGDLFYMNKLAETIKAYQGWRWEDEDIGVGIPGDVNSDNQVDVLDVQACVNHILGIQISGSRADVNQDGSVDVLDVQVIVNIILGV